MDPDLRRRVVPSVDHNSCKRVYDRFYPTGSSCGVGNPIFPLAGTKRQAESLTIGAGPSLQIVYDTTPLVPVDGNALHPFEVPPASFGWLWASSQHKRLVSYSLTGTFYSAQVARGGNLWSTFNRDGAGNYYSLALGSETLSLLPSNAGWRLYDRTRGVLETYDFNGVARTSAKASGGIETYQYSTSVVAGKYPTIGLLAKITDQFDRVLEFWYKQPQGTVQPRVYKAILPDGEEIGFTYDTAGNLETLRWPGEETRIRTFLYSGSLLTGILDEEGRPYTSYSYRDGLAFSTEYAGGVGLYEASWPFVGPSWSSSDTWDSARQVIWRDHFFRAPGPTTQLRTPEGSSRTLTAATVTGIPRQTSSSQPGGSGCEAASNRTDYDPRGNVILRVGFDNRATCFAYPSDRNVEAYRVEGWPAALADQCASTDLASYKVPADSPADKPQRKITTLWHPLWNLEARRAEPKRITTTVYNDQHDPITNESNVICAPDAPTLPDGVSKIAVVCRRYEQSTADETGNLGFNAAETDKRSWSYTYNQYGQLMSEKDPRGQASGKVTAYEYWPSTAFTGDVGHWQGDLSKVTNALGQTTHYLEYNKRGQPLKIQHPNNSIEQREYWPRGWLKSVTLTPADGAAPEVTEYTYYATGLLKKATQPDGSWTFYTWDDAHRLINVKDSADNSVEYVLDDLGNRKSEIYKGPQDALVKAITRTFDALGRMDSSKGAQ